ncbi:MAG TPA: FlgD immunoglobulin-like domain containing protein, partial [Bacteroidota bacterium]|nr:FlgD immunoglobulin-like domain containing protein [Bacteroidota bacterium]
DSPVYPVKIESVFVHVSSITANPMLLQILDGSTGAPGTVLAETSLTAIVGYNSWNLSSRNIVINSGRWFVGGRGQMAFSYETTSPISYRAWEYTGGWAPYRSADLQDCLIRCTVRQLATDVGEPDGVPSQFALEQNYPNPFNPTTTIRYALPKSARVMLRVYDMLGREVKVLKDDLVAAGTHEVVWDGKNAAGSTVASGVYFYQMEARPTDGSTAFTSMRKMLLVK